MFSSGFPYEKLHHRQKEIGSRCYIEHIYRFRGASGKHYIVQVEQYDFEVYVVKFFLRDMKDSPHRYNILTNLNECTRVLTTVADIMKEVLRENPYASFAFIGSRLQNEQSDVNTKRYRFYTKIVANKISNLHLEHHHSDILSAYLMLNRDSSEPNLIKKLRQMFDELYNLYE